jgi:hypothetical protein
VSLFSRFTFYIHLVINEMMKITFAMAASGRSYFEKFMQALSTQDRAAILAVFKDIKIMGWERRDASSGRSKANYGK